MQAFVGGPVTAAYHPSAYGWQLGVGTTGQVYSLFSLNYVEVMRRDPRVQFAFRVLQAPIKRVKWTVESDDTGAKASLLYTSPQAIGMRMVASNPAANAARGRRAGDARFFQEFSRTSRGAYRPRG